MEREAVGMALELRCFCGCRYVLAGARGGEEVEVCLLIKVRDGLLLQAPWKQKVGGV